MSKAVDAYENSVECACVTRGAHFNRTSSTGKLAFLDNLVAVFEHDVNESGNVSNKYWEWK